MMADKDAQLRSCVRAIFASCNKLGMDDATRRAMLESVAGVNSTKALTFDTAMRVLDHLRNRRAAHPEGTRRRSTPAPELAPQRAKIEALLRELAAVTGETYGIRYADAIAKKKGWGECVDFCDADGLKNVISALNRTLSYKQRALHP